MKNFVSLLVLLSLIGCKSKDPIIGTWERQGDEFKGLRIRVTQNSSTINGELVRLPDNGDTLFSIGDIKWKNIKKVDENKYVFEDLAKYEETFGTLFQNRYDESFLTIDRDKIKTRVFAKSDELVGTEQNWKRIKE